MQERGALPRTFFSLQICRGVAALLVVLFHLGAALAAPKYFDTPAFNRIFLSGGAAGVYFFFILSGFIITTVHWRDVGNARRLPGYIFKRFMRVYPIYWAVFGLVLTGLALTHYEDFPNDVSTVLVALALVPQDAAVVGGTGAPLVVVAWSLQYEVLFYIFFALLIASRTIGCLAAAAAIIWFLLAGIGVDVPLSFLRSSLLGLFVAGMLVALVVRAGHWVPSAPYAVAIGIGGFIGLGVTASFTSTLNFEGATWVMAYGLSAALVVFGLATLERQGWSPRWPAGVALGDASYVLYLVHYPLISIVCKAGVRAGLSGFPGAALAWLATLFVCISVAVALHRWFERPLLWLVQQPFAKKSLRT
jgi:peptidoglycan/LPS O-acetylase OafA/YrhL